MQAPFFNENKTFLVNDFLEGPGIDVLNTLQSALNFTCLLYKNKDVVWGSFYTMHDGRINSTGIVGSVYRKEVDLAYASLTMTSARLDHVDFIPTLRMYELGLYISRNAISQDTNLILFFTPFQDYLWMMIILSTLLIAVTKSFVIEWTTNPLSKIPHCFWSSLKVYFGHPPTDLQSESEPYRQIVFVSLLFGQIVWISYCAFLTSELAITEHKYPLNDLVSLSETDFRLLTHVDTAAISLEFINSKPGTLYNKIYTNNMDLESFLDSNGIKIVSERPNTALYLAANIVHRSEYFSNCQIQEVMSQYQGPFSMAIGKFSPYKDFINQIIIDMESTGTLSQIKKRWAIKKPKCNTNEVESIVPQKIISCFIGIVIGMVTSLVVLIMEKVLARSRLLKKSSNDTSNKLTKEFEDNFYESFKQMMELRSQLHRKEFNLMIERLQKGIDCLNCSRTEERAD